MIEKGNERDPEKKGDGRKEGGGEVRRNGEELDLAFDVNFAKGFSPRRLER
jgi:hypothetical protein